MKKTVKFYINRTQNSGGPSIFGYRLKQELIRNGWRWDRLFPSVAYMFSAGPFRPFCRNILRLDGLYLDSENTIGDSEVLNRPIMSAYRKADGIIFQSEFSRSLFGEFAGRPSCQHVVIHNGVSPDFCPGGERVDYGFEKTLICSGKWRTHKRLDCIIEGFLEYGDPSAGLVVLGWDIKRRIEHPNIRYVGRIPPGDLPKYLRGADAFIHLTWLDNCPNVVAEALSCGLPVLCNHNGGTKEIVGSNGIVIRCEEDYNFKKVALYDPPRCDKKIVAKGIEQILEWKRPVDAVHLRIEDISQRYIGFAEGLLRTADRPKYAGSRSGI